MSLEHDMERGRVAVARVRRDVWPEYGGEWPEESTQEDLMRYVEALEAEVAGQSMAISMIGSVFRGSP